MSLNLLAANLNLVLQKILKTSPVKEALTAKPFPLKLSLTIIYMLYKWKQLSNTEIPKFDWTERLSYRYVGM